MAPKSGTKKDSLNKLIDQFNSIPPKKRSLILVAILVVIIGACTYFLFLPKYNRVGLLTTNLQKLNTELASARKNAAEIDSVKKQIQTAEAEFEMSIKALPETEEIPVLLTSISKAGQEENLDFLLFEPQKETAHEFYAEIPVKLEVVGDYHDIARFFSKVANLPRIVVIRSITMKPYTGNITSVAQKAGYNLSVSCIAATYKFVDTITTTPAPASGGGGGRFKNYGN